MKNKLLERVPRKCFADRCEIVGQGGKKYLKIFVSKGRGRCNRIFAEGKEILCEGNIYCCYQSDGSYILCYFDSEKRQILTVSKPCHSHFLKNTFLFFKKRSIWYCFDLQCREYLRLGVLREEGFWMPPRDRLRGGCSSVDVYFFYNGEFVKKHCERVVKVIGRDLYFMKNGRTVSVLTGLAWTDRFLRSGSLFLIFPLKRSVCFFRPKEFIKNCFIRKKGVFCGMRLFCCLSVFCVIALILNMRLF